jgi:hypothetical protein
MFGTMLGKILMTLPQFILKVRELLSIASFFWNYAKPIDSTVEMLTTTFCFAQELNLLSLFL